MRRRLVEFIGVAVVLVAVIGLLERAHAPGVPATGLGGEDQAFAEGRGPDPVTRDNATGGGTIGDPLGR